MEYSPVSEVPLADDHVVTLDARELAVLDDVSDDVCEERNRRIICCNGVFVNRRDQCGMDHYLPAVLEVNILLPTNNFFLISHPPSTLGPIFTRLEPMLHVFPPTDRAMVARTTAKEQYTHRKDENKR